MYAGVPITEPATVSVATWLAGGALASAGSAATIGFVVRGTRTVDSGLSASSRFFASPQSITTVSPNSPISTLAGLRSRCTTRWLCAYAIASVAAAIRGSSARRASRVRAAAITRSSGRPETSFIAKNGSPDGQRPAS
jgi:hypothetical protein